MDIGIAYWGGGKSPLTDVITWHTYQDKRVWVHSRQSGKSGRRTISLTLQTFGYAPPPVSTEEKKLRLKLAMLHEYQNSEEITASVIREISTGEILESHSQLLMEQLVANSRESSNKVKLVTDVKSIKSSSKVSKNIVRTPPNVGFLSGNLEDALLIAKVYVWQTESGTKNAARKTAEILGIESDLVYLCLRTARRKKWLSSNGVGKSGGDLTDEGEIKYREFQTAVRFAKVFNSYKGLGTK
jgi:hypothetical protein